jgi:hypothetical protein
MSHISLQKSVETRPGGRYKQAIIKVDAVDTILSIVIRTDRTDPSRLAAGQCYHETQQQKPPPHTPLADDPRNAWCTRYPGGAISSLTVFGASDCIHDDSDVKMMIGNRIVN